MLARNVLAVVPWSLHSPHRTPRKEQVFIRQRKWTSETMKETRLTENRPGRPSGSALAFTVANADLSLLRSLYRTISRGRFLELLGHAECCMNLKIKLDDAEWHSNDVCKTLSCLAEHPTPAMVHRQCEEVFGAYSRTDSTVLALLRGLTSMASQMHFTARNSPSVIVPPGCAAR